MYEKLQVYKYVFLFLILCDRACKSKYLYKTFIQYGAADVLADR